ncbi:MAG TPA: hypothetical protein VF163_21575 [Micromonosporaceae bacterium]|jgi:hypothetical protein
MNHRTIRLVGAVNASFGTAGLLALVTSYGLAERLVLDQEAAKAGTLAVRTWHWVGPDIPVTLSMSLMLVGAAAGIVGSAIQQSIIFAHRAGHGTLERGFVWWYLLRPVWSALLGTVAVIAVNAGLVSIGDQTTSDAGVTVLVTFGCFAGLFTDRVLDKLRDMLGATDPAAFVAANPSPATT